MYKFNSILKVLNIVLIVALELMFFIGNWFDLSFKETVLTGISAIILAQMYWLGGGKGE